MNALTAQSQKRREDGRLVTGHGRYTGDNRPEDLLHLVFVRSPHAHARIVRIDVAAAAAAEGVVAVLTGADLLAAGLKHLPGGFPYPLPGVAPAPRKDRPALAMDRVRFVGEAAAAVVAATRAEAIAAAEQVEIDYEDTPAVCGVDAIREGAPAVWDAAPDNIAFRWQGGDAEATETALKSAKHVTRLTMTISRVSANPMEPRNFLARPMDDGRLLVHASHQSPFNLRGGLETVGFEKNSIQIQSGDVGGSFGLKMGTDPEAIVVAHAARALRRPVLWESSRNESFQADEHARELKATGEIGFDKTNRIVGLRILVHANLGAYVSGKSWWSVGNIGGIAGVYDIAAIHADLYGILTHTSPTSAYRGAGRPEATYMIERLLDVAARELAVSPFALRRRNLIPSSAMPYRTALAFTYDCGEFEANMDTAETLAGVAGFDARRAEAARRGKLRGIGVCNCIEVAGGPINAAAPDIARVSLLTDGRLRVQSGSMSVGQGHETTFPQIVADRFGVPGDRVEYQQGDTDLLPFGRGNGGSSGLCVGGSAVSQAATDTGGIADQRCRLASGSTARSGDPVRRSIPQPRCQPHAHPCRRGLKGETDGRGRGCSGREHVQTTCGHFS
jgi:carbon-monoxide dehydrogenase large subunit